MSPSISAVGYASLFADSAAFHSCPVISFERVAAGSAAIGVRGHCWLSNPLMSRLRAQAGGAMYGVLAADGGLAGLAAARGAQPLVPSDLLLLTNFVAAHDSFRLVRPPHF